MEELGDLVMDGVNVTVTESIDAIKDAIHHIDEELDIDEMIGDVLSTLAPDNFVIASRLGDLTHLFDFAWYGYLTPTVIALVLLLFEYAAIVRSSMGARLVKSLIKSLLSLLAGGGATLWFEVSRRMRAVGYTLRIVWGPTVYLYLFVLVMFAVATVVISAYRPRPPRRVWFNENTKASVRLLPLRAPPSPAYAPVEQTESPPVKLTTRGNSFLARMFAKQV